MNTFSIFLVLIAIVCFLLIVVIMVQNPKGGGLSSTIGGSQMLGGVQKTTDFLDKSTWALGTILIVLVLLSSISFTGALNDNESKIIQNVNADNSAKTVVPATNQPTSSPNTPAAPPAPVDATPVAPQPSK